MAFHSPFLPLSLPLSCPKAPVHFFLFSSCNAPLHPAIPRLIFFFICKAGFALLKISIHNALLVSVALSL